MRAVDRVARAWSWLWFRDGSPYDLAGARVVIALHALWVLLSRDLAGMTGIPDVFWSDVPASRQWRYLAFPGQPGLESALQWLCVGILVLAAAGVATRITCLLAALLLYHLAPLESIVWNHSAMERGFEVSILALAVLAFAPCSDVWSPAASRRPEPRAHWRYHWPLALIQLFLVQIYLFAAYSKLSFSGLSWIDPESLRRWFLALTQLESIAVFVRPGLSIAAQPVMLTVLGGGALALELALPLVLVFRRLRVWLIPPALAFHLITALSMNIAFLNAPQLLVFVNFDWLRRRFYRPRNARFEEEQGVSAA